MQIRFSLAQTLETPGVSLPDVDIDLQTDSYSTQVRSVWSAFLLSLSDLGNVRPEKDLQQPGSEKTHIVHDKRQAGAPAASAALTPEACIDTQTVQPSNSPEQMPVLRDAVSDAQATDGGEPSYGFDWGHDSDSLHVVALSGLDALLQSNKDWIQLANETFQACVWSFAQTARQYVQPIPSYPDSKILHRCSVLNVQPQILCISK